MDADRTNAEVARIVADADRSGLSDEGVLDQIKRLAARSETRGRALAAPPPAERPTKGPRLRDDPRYLTGVRALARRTQSNARIVGGDAVTNNEFDDCVAVGGDGFWGCTGTLIAPDVVLTAGHCQELHTRVFVGNNVSGEGRVVGIRDHVRHQRFTDGGLRNDLMLLFLEKKVTGVSPRKIAGAALVDKANDARVVGFGTTDFGGTTGYGLKRKADVPIVSQACRGRVGSKSDTAVYGCHAGLELVAGKPLLLVDTCRGDSGGPLYIQDAQRNWLLAGVTSRGTGSGPMPGARLCGDGGMYVRVDEYRDWIAQEIKKRGGAPTKKAAKKTAPKKTASKKTASKRTASKKAARANK